MSTLNKRHLQEIYFNLDDSGKLSKKEAISVYGGLVFLSKADKDKFITQYRSIINNIKCHYCDHANACDHICPEIKNTNIKPSHKRWLMNYIKKYYVVALIIQNPNVYEYIMNNTAAKGRFLDYSIRRLIKSVIEKLIKTKAVDASLPLRLIINIDEQTTKNNGYYNLRDGLFEELKYGIANYNYGMKINPIWFGDLDISLTYQESKNSYVVQAADLTAGTIRKIALEAEENNQNIFQKVSVFAEYVMILP